MTNSESSRELDQLMQINEELLRSKGKLLQQIIELKKQVHSQAKNLALIESLQDRLNQAKAESVDHLLNLSIRSAELDEVKNQLKELSQENENLKGQIVQMKKVRWYTKILGKR